MEECGYGRARFGGEVGKGKRSVVHLFTLSYYLHPSAQLIMHRMDHQGWTALSKL